MNNKRTSPIERFWAKQRYDGACVVWTGAKDAKGYGYFWSGDRLVRAHRWIHERCFGSVAPGLVVMHSCDRPSCVALQHLSVGTHKQNKADSVAKGRARGGRVPKTRNTKDQVTP